MAIKFYSPRRKPYGCFSNFSRHRVIIDDKEWPTSEHYYQAMKFPNDPGIQEQIRKARTPTETKRIAQKHKGRIRSDWHTYCNEVMLKVVRQKFKQNEEIRQILLSTGDEELIEHTPRTGPKRDCYWGDCGDSTGQNKLGQILMQVREELHQLGDTL